MYVDTIIIVGIFAIVAGVFALAALSEFISYHNWKKPRIRNKAKKAQLAAALQTPTIVWPVHANRHWVHGYDSSYHFASTNFFHTNKNATIHQHAQKLVYEAIMLLPHPIQFYHPKKKVTLNQFFYQLFKIPEFEQLFETITGKKYEIKLAVNQLNEEVPFHWVEMKKQAADSTAFNVENRIMLATVEKIKKNKNLKLLTQQGHNWQTISEIIEKAHVAAKNEVHKEIEQAMQAIIKQTLQMQFFNNQLLLSLGKLNYLFSQGQNVLQHSYECAYIASALASYFFPTTSEVVNKVKIASFFHDLGKLDNGQFKKNSLHANHVYRGIELAKQHHLPDYIINTIASSHAPQKGDNNCHYYQLPNNIAAIFSKIADHISASRPGARIENFGSNKLKMLNILLLDCVKKNQEFAKYCQYGELKVRPDQSLDWKVTIKANCYKDKKDKVMILLAIQVFLNCLEKELCAAEEFAKIRLNTAFFCRNILLFQKKFDFRS